MWERYGCNATLNKSGGKDIFAISEEIIQTCSYFLMSRCRVSSKHRMLKSLQIKPNFGRLRKLNLCTSNKCYNRIKYKYVCMVIITMHLNTFFNEYVNRNKFFIQNKRSAWLCRNYVAYLVDIFVINKIFF